MRTSTLIERLAPIGSISLSCRFADFVEEQGAAVGFLELA